MIRHKFIFAASSIAAALSVQIALGQIAAPPAVGPQPSLGNQALRANSIETGKAVALVNKIVTPLPLSAVEKEGAVTAINKKIVDASAEMQTKIKALMPDELAVLAKTTGWKAEEQQSLLTALRAGDPAAVYEAWTKAAPTDTAGAEIVARQTEVKKTIGRLVQDAEKNQAAVRQDVIDLDTALGKISATTPGVNDLMPNVKHLKTLAEARQFVETASIGTGNVAKIPTGKISLIYDPGLETGTAVVLSKDAMLIGNEGHPPLRIDMGNAAEALGMPIVSTAALPDAEGEPMLNGVMLVNPKSTQVTINYSINGNHYIMEPGMAQRLPAADKWILDYDRGASFGPATYELKPGTYHFTPSDQGIQTFQQRYDVVFDNTLSKQEFNFIYNGENMVVPANGTKSITSWYPMVVRYDRGNGAAFAVKSVNFAGNVQVGVNSADNMWDLFPTNDNQKEVTKLKLFK